MPEVKPEEKIVFAVGHQPSGVPVIIVGVPALAWEYMKDGKTHHFDLTKIGVQAQFMIFGCPTREDAVLALSGSDVARMDNRDFSIPDLISRSAEVIRDLLSRADRHRSDVAPAVATAEKLLADLKAKM